MLTIVLLVLGITMIAIPKKCTKKDRQEDPEAVKKTRISGIVLVCVAILWEVVAYFILQGLA
ncbi:MAG: permease [Lachnospiraceae bacterium]|nr:permease [Lachnospiraceae bacterium]